MKSSIEEIKNILKEMINGSWQVEVRKHF
jgi:hypothetical protein